MYLGNLIIEILEAAEEESSTAVKEAYESGYKEGRIDSAALWKTEYEKLDAQYEKPKKGKAQAFLLSFVYGFIGGCLATGAVAFCLR